MRRARARRASARRRTRPWVLPSAALVAVVAIAAVVATAVTHADRASGATRATRPIRSLATPAGTVTVSPAPGSRTAPPDTQLSFLGRPVGRLGTITVRGSRSGLHAGRLLAYSTGDGASFVPDTAFVIGEVVTVHTSLPIIGSAGGTYRFTIGDVVPLRAGPHPPALATDVVGVQHFATAPAIQPPGITVDTPDPGLTGDFFLAPKGTTGQAGPMIVRPDGQLVWFKPLPDHTEAFDLNEQRLHGKAVLTWIEGEVVAGHGVGEAVIANDHYTTIAVVHGGNGVQVDLHDLQLTNRGTVFVTAYRTIRWPTLSDGGTRLGTVFDGVIQEIDVKTGLVEEEWNSLDHVPVSASYFTAPKNPAAPFDYFHINGVQPLPGGDLLISSRNTSAAYEVNPARGGAVVWELGGKRSSFTMGPGSTFWYEHDVRLHPGNLVSIFDDGASPAREPASRALVLRLDLTAHTATVVDAFTHPGGLLASALGNVQALKNGDLAVGWGTAPNFSVLSPSGQLLYDATMPAGDDSYRAYLHPWSGAPATPPTLAVGPSAGTVAVSWNGATRVARWEVLTGSSPGTLHQVTSTPDTAFQTTLAVPRLGRYVQAVAVAADGKVLGRSAVSG